MVLSWNYIGIGGCLRMEFMYCDVYQAIQFQTYRRWVFRVGAGRENGGVVARIGGDDVHVGMQIGK